MRRILGLPLRPALLALTVGLLLAGPAAAAEYWTAAAGRVAGQLARVEALYRAGDREGSYRALVVAYFDGFESSKMEAALRKELGAQPTRRVERQFRELRKAIQAGAGEPAVAGRATALKAALLRRAAQLDAAAVPPDVYRVEP